MTVSFGTDGMRGVANVDLTAELVCALGRAAARVFARSHGDLAREWLIGRDPRQSGPMLQAALSAGLASEGATVVDLGVLPTPGVAFHSTKLMQPAAMISASHNPFMDNGVKFFAPGGLKLGDAIEQELEAELARVLATPNDRGTNGDGVVHGSQVGVLRRAVSAGDEYVEFVQSLLGGNKAFAGKRVVLDCANGAASRVANDVFSGLGAEVTVLHNTPDGTNINLACGSTHPEDLQAEVIRLEADLGLAFDGDADRLIAVDNTGAIVDGDRVIALCALDRAARSLLPDRTVVVTVMTNLGFRLAMQDAGINVVETKVGDRYVLEALEANGWTLGGEQSGHVIFRDVVTTGDGILTGAYLLDVLVRSNKTMNELATKVMTRVPQVLENLHVADRLGLDEATSVWSTVREVEKELGDSGRVLLRASGTEPVVRVMVEATGDGVAEACVARICTALIDALGAA